MAQISQAGNSGPGRTIVGLLRSIAPARVALVFVTILGCGDEVTVEQAKAVLSADEVVDFGNVQVGRRVERTWILKNTGTGSVDITGVELPETFEQQGYKFEVESEPFTLQGNDEHPITVSFLPFSEMETPVESFFRILTDQEDASGELTTLSANVRGRGIRSSLIIDPHPVDFGAVLVGSSATMTVRIENAESLPVQLRSTTDGRGKPALVTVAGAGRFELLDSIEPSGSLIVDDGLLGPGESISVELRYIPDLASATAEDRGRWTISTCDEAVCKVDIELVGRGTNNALTCAPAAVDFGAVNPGASTSQTVHCENSATETITITGWSLEASSAVELSVAAYTGEPSILTAGESFDVPVTFSPTLETVGAAARGLLVIRGRNPKANAALSPTEISLSGTAGGPDISVLPEALHFGKVAVGSTATRRILIENAGFSDLEVTDIDADGLSTGLFTADRASFGVAVGASQVVEVSYSPLTEGIHTSEIVISSDDLDEPEVRIAVSGEGLVLPPCSYRIVPQALNFGVVEVLRSTRQGIRIDNTGTDDCYIQNLEVLLGSSQSFTLADPPPAEIILAPGASLSVDVEFVPLSEGAHEGALGFYVSDPQNANPEVSLHGMGASSALLVSPNEIDFGTVGVGCATRDRFVTLYNTGQTTATILDIQRAPGVTFEFVVDNLPAGIPSPPGAGATIPAGQSIEFSLKYQASDIGKDVGLAHIFEAGRADPYVIPLNGEGATDPENVDRFTQLESPKVDILFVIDNSCSMNEEQASLTSNFASFIQFADSQALDYRIAVVSTDVEGGFPGPSCPAMLPADRPLGMAQGACGYFADGSGGTMTTSDPDWRLITPDESPSPAQAFGAVATVGTAGSGNEQGLQAAYQALSSPLITGWNSGFLRPDAYLAMVFVSDEADHSSRSVDFYVNYFKAIKGFRNTHLFSASAIVGDERNGCGGIAGPGDRYIEVARRTGGIFESICTSDWATALQNLGLLVFGYKSKFFLSNQPVAGSVVVEIDGTVVDPVSMTGQVRWTYDAQANTVDFSPLAIPEPGSEIVIRYQAECL